jgi:catechol 2,3-dioxygenase-like lactoylglutathione lyase family enzyme
MNASLDTIALHVEDVEQSVAFYTRIPGAVVVAHRPGKFAEVRLGEGRLHLVQLPGPTRFHIELETENLNAMYEHLQAIGLNPSRPQQHPWGKIDFRFTDPDGNQLEFSEPWENQPAARANNSAS